MLLHYRLRSTILEFICNNKKVTVNGFTQEYQEHRIVWSPGQSHYIVYEILKKSKVFTSSQLRLCMSYRRREFRQTKRQIKLLTNKIADRNYFSWTFSFIAQCDKLRFSCSTHHSPLHLLSHGSSCKLYFSGCHNWQLQYILFLFILNLWSTFNRFTLFSVRY